MVTVRTLLSRENRTGSGFDIFCEESEIDHVNFFHPPLLPFLCVSKDFYECAVEAICANSAATAPILFSAVLTFSGS